MTSHTAVLLGFLLSSIAWCSPLSCAAAESINPVPRAQRPVPLHEWTFDENAEGWAAEHQCTVVQRNGTLLLESTGDDPYLHCALDLPGGRIRLEARVRSKGVGAGSVFWTTDRAPARSESRRVNLALPNDGEWHTTMTEIDAPGTITDLRLDPGTQPGLLEVDTISLLHLRQHPLTIESVSRAETHALFHVRNHAEVTTSFQVEGRSFSIKAEGAIDIRRDFMADRPLERVSVTIHCADWPPLTRAIFVEHDDPPGDWIIRKLGHFTLRAARDGTSASVSDQDQPVATLAPLALVKGRAAVMELIEERADRLVFANDEVRTTIALTAEGDLTVAILSSVECEGPVVRARGPLEQGLFAGLEYLGRGERSSSSLDIETPEHIRFAPDPLKVTMPLMAFVTDRVSASMTWSDMTLQPVYTTPNFIDIDGGHRMALRGKQINATLRFGRGSLAEQIYWAVQKQGLPALPKSPRSAQQQLDLCLQALKGPLRTESGWGHCVQSKWARRPYADAASTWWRLSGEVLDLPVLVPGGAHVRNDSIYFVTGRAEQWLDVHRRQTRNLIGRQQPDGSFRYKGKYARGHFEDTASGICALPAMQLLEFAYLTGDSDAREAGLRTLEYMRRFRTPRGAQTWECALHTPDQLASAYLVRAYLRGFQLTDDSKYLHEARRWALSGLPFTYLWSRYPVMAYSTPPVYGATNWIAPNWMGLPVQWVGGVYAYSLALLAPFEHSLDWNHVARGILNSAQQQQYPDGDHRGLLPDSFNLAYQRRQPADINPCALVSLQYVLDGQVDSLAVASNGEHRVTAPFAVDIRKRAAHIHARSGVHYQLLIDGDRIVDVVSKGEDVVPLD